MSIRRSGRIQARETNAVPARRAPLTDITTNALNTERESPRREPKSKRQKVSQENTEEPELAQIHNTASLESIALSQITIQSTTSSSDPILRLAIQRTTVTAPNTRPTALWSLNPSSPSLFTQAREYLPAHTRYQDVLHPLLQENPVWVASITDSIHAHHRRLEALPAYQLDLGYAPVLKTATGTDRAELVDMILDFSTRERLKHPTMHLAVHILDRYLAALLAPPERTPCEQGGATTAGPGTTSSSAEHGTGGADVGVLSQEAQELLGVPHALKCITSVCIWLAVKVEETQGQFDWRTLHHVVFRHVPEHQRPSENRLHLLMALVAKMLGHDLNPPTTYTFLCHLVPLAGFSSEDVLVARCLVERVLLEDPPPTTTNTSTIATTTAGMAAATSTSTSTSTSTVVQGRFPLSLVAASCTLLTRFLMLQRRASANNTTSNTTSNTTAVEPVWTAQLRHFSGYRVRDLHPCVTSLLRMLQQETYRRARHYALPLCPSGRFTELVLTVNAMHSVGSGGVGGVGVGIDPLQAYLRVLPSIFVHMQDSLIRDTATATINTITNTNTNTNTRPYQTAYNTQDTHTTQDSNTSQGSAMSSAGGANSLYTPVVFPTTAELRNTRMNALLTGASSNASGASGSASSASSGYDTPLFTQSSSGGTHGMFSLNMSTMNVSAMGSRGVVVPTPVRRTVFAPPSVSQLAIGTASTANAANTNATTTHANSTVAVPVFHIFGQGLSTTNNTTNPHNTNYTSADYTSTLPTNLAGEYSQLSQPSQLSLPFSLSQESERGSALSQTSNTTVDNNISTGGVVSSTFGAVFGRASSIGNTANTNTINTTTATSTTTSSFFDPSRMLYSQDGFSNQSIMAGASGVSGVSGVSAIASAGGVSGANDSVFGRVSALSAAANTVTTTFTTTSSNVTTSTPAQEQDRGGAFAAFVELRPRNTTTNTSGTSIRGANTTSTTTPSVLGRRDRSAFTTTTPRTNTSTNTTSITAAARTVTLPREVQDLYRLYPATNNDNTNGTTGASTSNTATTSNTTTVVRGVLDRALSPSTSSHLSVPRDSVRNRYGRVQVRGADGVVRCVDVYALLVRCPPA